MRITAQLIDTTNGAHLWADRFDGSLEDVFDLQDKVALNVAGVIEPALQAAEIHDRVNGRPKILPPTICICVRFRMSSSRDRPAPHAFDLLSAGNRS